MLLEIKNKFEFGKSLLDSSQFNKSIEIFSELIIFSENLEKNNETKLIIHTCLTNRGVGKCKLALIENNKQLYKEGLADFEKALNYIENKEGLIAFDNLIFGKKELQSFNDSNQ